MAGRATPHPTYWVMDVGNTRTKLAAVRHGKLGRIQVIETASLDQRSLIKFLPKDRTRPLVLASVMPAKTMQLETAWKGDFFSVKGRNVPGLAFDYPKPEGLGADRLANAVAAKTLYGAPVVVMDFGTALDVEVINRDGAFCGGALVPGRNLMLGSLTQGLAMLSGTEWKKPTRAIAKSTQAAIQSGCYVAYRGFIKEMLAEIKRELGVRRIKLIITGGQGKDMVQGLSQVTAVNPLLTLEGLRIIGASLYGKSN